MKQPLISARSPRSVKQPLTRLTPWLFVLPATLIMVVACLYPVLQALRLSFYNWSIGTPWTEAVFTGAQYFGRLAQDPAVRSSLLTTLLFAATVVIAEMILGLVLALALEKPMRGLTLFRTVFILPMMIAPIVVGLTWRFLFDTNFGAINALMTSVGVGKITWLADPNLAFFAVVVADIWQWTPFVFIMLAAGLQNLDGAVMEAAAIDGATPWQAIWTVKLPMLMPIIVVTLLLRLIDAFRVLEVVYIMTGGGPGNSTEILSMHIYKTAFSGGQLGYASAISVLLLAVVMGLSVVVLRLSNPLSAGKKA
ncbi:carbohydrate ABC transporter permease [Deinococcus marmoris]|uniref:carbohydrate ABC transporter permease n=1 Tax=Deinococcus marmoris TaxID=249408 RepID=UPI000A7F4874|nr:sugar ABC transporter permease [Deinococcus marmoris]